MPASRRADARLATPAGDPGIRPIERRAMRRGEQPDDGIFSPLAFLRFIGRHFLKIGLLTGVLTVGGVALFTRIPFPYHSTATVLVDPRNQQVTLQEDVLSPIGSDAAILESMVQILKSDGFLLTVMEQIGHRGEGWKALNETEKLKELVKFKRDLTVERKGATYLVEVGYKAETATEAARIANDVATSFANTQNGYLAAATQGAAEALSARLVELRRKLDASEQAVAEFAAKHGIVYVDGNSTLQTRQLTELSAQLAAARIATGQARARYQSQLAGNGEDFVVSADRSGETAQLAFLRQQRAQLTQTLEQLSQTYGPRHPRIAETRRQISSIDRQMTEERQRLLRQLKGALDVAEAQQEKLEADVRQLSAGVMLTDAEEVRLEALRREAAADRDIYEKFLARNKTTDELAEIRNENVKVVSPAVPPLRNSRPPLALVAPVLAVLSGIASIAIVAMAGAARPRRRFGAAEVPGSHEADPIETERAVRLDRTSFVQDEPAAPAASTPRRKPSGTSLLMLEKTLREDARRDETGVTRRA